MFVEIMSIKWNLHKNQYLTNDEFDINNWFYSEDDKLNILPFSVYN